MHRLRSLLARLLRRILGLSSCPCPISMARYYGRQTLADARLECTICGRMHHVAAQPGSAGRDAPIIAREAWPAFERALRDHYHELGIAKDAERPR